MPKSKIRTESRHPQSTTITRCETAWTSSCEYSSVPDEHFLRSEITSALISMGYCDWAAKFAAIQFHFGARANQDLAPILMPKPPGATVAASRYVHHPRKTTPPASHPGYQDVLPRTRHPPVLGKLSAAVPRLRRPRQHRTSVTLTTQGPSSIPTFAVGRP